MNAQIHVRSLKLIKKVHPISHFTEKPPVTILCQDCSVLLVTAAWTEPPKKVRTLDTILVGKDGGSAKCSFS